MAGPETHPVDLDELEDLTRLALSTDEGDSIVLNEPYFRNVLRLIEIARHAAN